MATAKFTRAGKAHPPASQSGRPARVRRRRPKSSLSPSTPPQPHSPNLSLATGRFSNAQPNGVNSTVNECVGRIERLPTDALLEVRAKMKIATAVVYISAATLRAQNTDYDSDVALCLQRCAGDELDRQIERIDLLLKGVAS